MAREPGTGRCALHQVAVEVDKLFSLFAADGIFNWLNRKQTMTVPKTLRRAFLLSFLAQFTFSFVFCILIPTLPIYLLRFGAKEGEIGFIIGIFSVSSLILRPFVGKALLSIPERDFMVAGNDSVCTLLPCLSRRPSFLAAPDRAGRSGDWLGLFCDCLLHLVSEYASGGSIVAG